MRDIETIEAERRLVAALLRAAGAGWTAAFDSRGDALLDERRGGVEAALFIGLVGV